MAYHPMIKIEPDNLFRMIGRVVHVKGLPRYLAFRLVGVSKSEAIVHRRRGEQRFSLDRIYYTRRHQNRRRF